MIATLLSYQLSEPELVDPVRTFWMRIGSRGDVAAYARELASPIEKMSSVFREAHLHEDNVYILVDLPPSEPIVVVLTIANCSRLPISFEIVIRCR